MRLPVFLGAPSLSSLHVTQPAGATASASCQQCCWRCSCNGSHSSCQAAHLSCNDALSLVLQDGHLERLCSMTDLIQCVLFLTAWLALSCCEPTCCCGFLIYSHQAAGVPGCWGHLRCTQFCAAHALPSGLNQAQLPVAASPGFMRMANPAAIHGFWLPGIIVRPCTEECCDGCSGRCVRAPVV